MKQLYNAVSFDRLEKKIPNTQHGRSCNGKVQKEVAIHQLFAEPAAVPILGRIMYYGKFDRHYYYRQKPISDRVGVEFVLEGSLLVRRAGEILKIEPGEVFMILPETEVTLITGPEGYCVKYSFPIVGKVVPDLLAGLGLTAGRDVRQGVDPENLKRLLEQLRQSGYTSQETNSMICYQILLLLASEKSTPPMPTPLDAVRNRMLREYDRAFTVPELAALAGCSESAFAQNFRTRYGQTPHQFLTRVRMENAAKLLLENPGLLVKAIAVRVGYNDALNFSTAFRAVHHMSPREFRNRQMRFWGCANIAVHGRILEQGE